MPDSPLLSLRNWSLERQSAAGTQTVLRDVSLDILPGRWLAVIGANGSGKSSLLKFLASDESPVADRAAIMLQDPDEQIFATAVDREITLGRGHLDAARVRGEFELGTLGEMDPRLLSAGQKQRLALAVALGCEPEILLCDEPTSLQDGSQANWVLDHLDQWRRRSGGALVTATCDWREVERADEILVLDEGRIAQRGTAASLAEDPLVRSLITVPGDPAEPVATDFPDSAEKSETPVMTMAEVGCEFAGGGGLTGIDLSVGCGERWGLIGANGTGKSTLLAICAGARRPERGRVTLAGRELYSSGPFDLDHGRALLAPQFPEYMFSRSDVAAEISLDPVLAARTIPGFLAAAGLPADIAARNPHDLSSGQRRRLALGLVLYSGRPLVLLDEPTAALDRSGREMVLRMLAELPSETALMIASHDRDFLAQAGCRLRRVTSTGLVAG